MSTHQKYNDKNLIKYEDTIQLHFDEKGEHAWLTLKNYGGIFNTKSSDVVTELVVGRPATKEFERTISIGAMLNVIDVIHLQTNLATRSSSQDFSRRSLCKLIEDALSDRPLQITIPQFVAWRRDIGAGTL
jgi:hypothetical protein